MFLFKIITLLITASFFLAVSATALAGFLVLTGSPEPCVDRSTDPAPEANGELQANWLDVIERVGQGETVPLSLTEHQATALGTGYLEGEDVPVDDLRVFFCSDGTAEATGALRWAGLESNVLVKGALDVSGPQPVVVLDTVEAGSFPSVLGEKIIGLLVDKDDVLTLPITANIEAIEISDGEAIVAVGP